jgi:hypothetical protein
MPNRHKPIGKTDETLLSRYEETMARLKKMNDAGYNVVSILRCEFRKLQRDKTGLESELSSQTCVKSVGEGSEPNNDKTYTPPSCFTTHGKREYRC